MAWRGRKDMRWPEWPGHKEQNMDIGHRGTWSCHSKAPGTLTVGWPGRRWGYRWLQFGRISSGLCSAKKAR